MTLRILSPLNIDETLKSFQLPFMSKPVTSEGVFKIEYLVTLHDDPDQKPEETQEELIAAITKFEPIGVPSKFQIETLDTEPRFPSFLGQ